MVFILFDGWIVLVCCCDNNWYVLLGGMVEWGEDIFIIVKRELYEEIGLELVKICWLVGVYFLLEWDLRVYFINILVEVDVGGNMDVKDKLEISDV